MANQISEQDLEWMQQPVSASVSPDESAWLDAMLEMTRDELVIYSITQYGIPETAAENSSRDDLVQLIVMANKAGGGQSVLKTRFRYLNDLAGVLAPQNSKVRGNRLLFNTRGEGKQMQVWDKKTKQWVSYEKVRPVKHVAPTTVSEPTSTEPAAPALSLDIVLAMIEGGKMNRATLETVAGGLGIQDVADVEKFPTNATIIEAIKALVPKEEEGEQE